MPKSQRLYLVMLILLTCFGCDQVSKRVAKSTLENAPARSYLADTFRLKYAENSGAFLSLGAGLSERTRVWLFEILSAGLLGALFFYIMFNKELDRSHTFALALILAGGSSNLFDRMVNDGRVIDFMNMGIGTLRTGIFNWADVVIMVGMGLILVFSFTSRERQKDVSDTAPNSGGD